MLDNTSDRLNFLAFPLPFSFNKNNVRKVKSGFVGKTLGAKGVITLAEQCCGKARWIETLQLMVEGVS